MKKSERKLNTVFLNLAKKMEIAVLNCPDYYIVYFEIVEGIETRQKITFKVGYKTTDNTRYQYAIYSISNDKCYRNGVESEIATEIYQNFIGKTQQTVEL